MSPCNSSGHFASVVSSHAIPHRMRGSVFLIMHHSNSIVGSKLLDRLDNDCFIITFTSRIVQPIRPVKVIVVYNDGSKGYHEFYFGILKVHIIQCYRQWYWYVHILSNLFTKVYSYLYSILLDNFCNIHNSSDVWNADLNNFTVKY